MDTTLAKRYAQALLTLGEADGQYKKYGEELNEFSGAVTQAPEALRVLDSPVYSLEFRGKVLAAILEKAQLSPLVYNFMRLLFDRNRLALLSGIASAYGRLLDEKEGIVRGTVYTPAILSDRDFSAIREALGIYTGRKVEITQTLDTSLIGGVLARLGDLVLDGSVKTQLRKLASTFAAD
jgi:F-type H+-transporting ATPase subunit delta